MVSWQSPVTWDHPGWVTGPNMVRVRAQVGKTLVGGVQRGVGWVQKSSHYPSLPP